MHLDKNCTKTMLMVIVICTGILRKFYSAYLFGFSPDICINICIDIHSTSVFFCINIYSDVHSKTTSIYIEICITNILPIIASPDPPASIFYIS